jgi:hypothetical protein
MKSPPWIYPQFISPMSGRINTAGVQALTPNYTFVGDTNGFVIESPILIDIRLELIRLRNLLGTTAFIIQEEIAGFNNAQALNLVRNGMISVSNGIIIPTNLTQNKFWIGDENNFPVETDTLPSGGLPDLTFQNTWIGDSGNRPVETLFKIITGTGLTGGPIIGNGTISIANTGVIPNVYAYATVNVNSQGQIIAAADNSGQINSILTNLSNLANIVSALTNTVNALSSAVDAIETGIASIGGFASIILLQAQVLGLIGAVASHGNRLDNLESSVNIIQGQINDLYNQVTLLNTRIDNLRLNNIPADGNVSIYNFKLINVADPTNPQDAATKNYVDNEIADIPGSLIITLGGAVSGTGPSNTTIDTTFHWTLNQIAATNPTSGSVALNDHRIIGLGDPTFAQDGVNLRTLEDSIANLDITLEGFVIGGPAVDGVLETFRGPTCLLTNIPAGGDVSMDGFRIKDLNQSPIENFDAISAQFLWDLLHDEVSVTWL